MQVEVEPVDSEVLGKPVLVLRNFSADDNFVEIERAYVKRYQPGYVGCKVPVADIPLIHRLEIAGFQMVEVQISGSIIIRPPPDTTHYAYVYEKVTDPRILNEILEIAGTTFDTDRFYNDPELGPQFSSLRYKAYVNKSFDAVDEDVYRLYDPKDGKSLAFNSFKSLSATEVYSLLTGVRVDLKGSGFGVLIGHYSDAFLLAEGRRRIKTSISAANTVMIRYMIGTGRLSVEVVSAVLRKIYI